MSGPAPWDVCCKLMNDATFCVTGLLIFVDIIYLEAAPGTSCFFLSLLNQKNSLASSPYWGCKHEPWLWCEVWVVLCSVIFPLGPEKWCHCTSRRSNVSLIVTSQYCAKEPAYFQRKFFTRQFSSVFQHHEPAHTQACPQWALSTAACSCRGGEIAINKLGRRSPGLTLQFH